jgi:flagellar hook-associated protein 3 FlgL
MRVTQSSMYRSFLANVENLSSEMADLNQKVSTGSKMSHLSDSPSGSSEFLGLRTELAKIDQYKTNGDSSTFFLGVTDSVLNSLYNVATSIFVLGSQAASNLNSPDVRASVAEEIRSLRDQVFAFANTEARGRHIFAGSRIDAPAFTISGDTVAYQGDTEVNGIVIDEGLAIEQNVIGSSVFSPIFDRISALLTALDNGDPTAIQDALNQFSSGLEAVSRTRARVGSNLKRLEDSQVELGTRETIVRTRQSRIQDVDLAEAVVQLNQIQTALKAALSAQSIVQQHNLFDFIG